MTAAQAEPGRPPAEAPIIELRGVTKVYGEGALAFQALRGVDLRIAQGDFVAIMGPSGSGKSTAMNTLGCLDRPTTGEYLFKGVHVEALSRDERALLRRRYFGFVFQGFNLLARTSAQENVELPLLYRGESAATRKAAAARALDAVGLKGWEHHTPAELSGGQQQRVAIARAIVTEPVVLLADEPTGNLDTQRSHEIMELLWRLNAEQGITVLMVTHEPDMAEYARAAWCGLSMAWWIRTPSTRTQSGCVASPPRWWLLTPARESRDAVQHHLAGVALHPAQPDALVPDHPGHRDRGERGDHHGDAGQRRHLGCADANLQPGHQPAASAAWPAHGAGWWYRRAVIQGHRCRRDCAADRRHLGRGAGGASRRHGGRRRAQLDN